MNVTSWKKVGIDVQSALASAKTITAIAKASSCVVTATHDYAAGDYVVLAVSGMPELDGRAFRVLSVSTTVSFILEGVDSTLFGTFISGTAQKITFGLSMSTVQNVNASGGEPKFTDVTTIHDDSDQEMPNGFSAVKFQMQNIWDPADTALIALGAASSSKTTLCVLFRFANGKKLVFNAYIAAALTPSGSEKVETPISFSVRGKPQAFAS